MKALIRAPFAEEWVDRLSRQLDVVYEPWTAERRIFGPDDLAARVQEGGFSILLVEADFMFGPVFAVPGLRLAGTCRNSLDQVDLKAATEHGVPVLHAPGRNNTAVAELAIGLMIAIARHIPAAHEHVAGGSWTDPMHAYIHFQGREIAGSVVGIVGLGQIGREVAARAQALGAKVLAFDPNVAKADGPKIGIKLVSLETLLRESDFVTMHTAQIKTHVIDAGGLDLMKATAYLINTGAPGALDYVALAERLQAGRIAGAALDVYPGFVLATDSPLLKLDNVILTPHIGGATRETIERQSRMLGEEVERFVQGKRLRRVVNPQALKVARGR